MKVLKKIVLALVILVVLIVGAAAIAIETIDVNQYRDQIASALSKQLGRTVKFEGPIRLAMSTHGVGMAVENASIGNPPWASRAQMASIGKLELGIALAPLLNRQLVVSELDIANADIQLETNAANQHNWDMKPASPQGAAPTGVATPPASSSSSMPAVGVRVNELSIMNSQLTMRDKDGKVSTFKVEKLTLAPEGHGIAVAVNADYNGTPIKLSLKATTDDLMSTASWPYDADLTYANYHLTAQGTADIGGKNIDLNPYEFSAGSSSLHGQIKADFSGAKLAVRGTIMGDRLDPADLKPPAVNGGEKGGTPGAPAPEQAAGQSGPLFSTAPLDLSALKSADATIDVAIGEVPFGKSSLKQVNGKIALAEGNLTVSPLKAMLGESALDGTFKLQGAASPAQYNLSFKAPGVDVATLLEMIGTQAFMTGKGDADIELSGSGNSPHDLASSTNGHIEITAANGTISTAAAGGIADGLAQIFAPGGGANPTLNCVATRFNVTNGVGKDNGILADSSASTVSGSGGFDLGKETVDLTLDAKPKLVNTKGFAPAVLITGPLTGPKIGIDTAGVAQNVASTLLKNKGGALGGLLGNSGSSSGEASVPAMQTAPDGQNACIYTLDHKAAASAAAPQNNAVKSTGGTPATKAKDLGNQLMKGLLGH